ncbi:MAG: FAD-dependent oxidoreductase [Chitinophagaceae bacterium]
MDRRKFLGITAGAGIIGLLPSCKAARKIGGSIVGSSAGIGHMLRDQRFDEPVAVEKKQAVIVGGGVSGLTAAWHLKKNGVNDFVLLELEEVAGGNSRYGSNAVSAYPWGAHYVPIPNNDLPEYLSFLNESGVITGFNDKGLPVYNEQYLCFDPQERLYINGRWQEGIIPQFGVPDAEAKEIAKFLQMMEEYRQAKGSDGKDAFAIPVDQSSKDEAFTVFDSITMTQWLKQHNLNSQYLHWYVDYCTRDDFGTPCNIVSAWMGIHYFASRKGKGANAEHGDVLTWPEGNGFLVNQLTKNIGEHISTGNLAVSIKEVDGNVRITYFDTKTKNVKAIEAAQCIVAVPQFIAARLLNNQDRLQQVHRHLQYAPWMVANITVSTLEERSGAPLSWDNVLYDSPSLGYVEATHQFLEQQLPKRNLTYYLPLTKLSPSDERKAAQQKTHGEWVDLILNDLRKVHPGIEEAVEKIDVLLWGHAMAQPLPGLVHGNVRSRLSASINERIHFAHTDLAGDSIFEEAFYQGLNAGKKLITKMKSHV